MGGLRRGEIHWALVDKRRPVVLLSRNEAYAVRRLVIVAPISTRIRGFAGEVRLGRSDGLPKTCAINVDALMTIPVSALVERIATLSSAKLGQVDAALRFVLGLEMSLSS
jgi:mRNA interferase MazF